MQASTKKIIAIGLKITIVVLALWYIYGKLTTNNDLKGFLQLVATFPTSEIFLVLSTVVMMMLVNWGLEALKWKWLIRRVEAISTWRAIESVFCGLTWAVFTPNRLGEYGGRVFFLSPKRRIVGVVAMAIGGLGQLVATNVIGATALCIFIYKFELIDRRLAFALFSIATVFCFFFLIFFFNIKWLNSLLLSNKYTARFRKFYAILGRYKKRELVRILCFSLARYAVFTLEYLVMFNWLMPEISSAYVLLLMCVLFFVQSSLPSLDLLDLGVRSITALFFFKFVTDKSAAVVACIASIWFINIIIPAILGSIFVFKLKFFGNRTSSH